MRNSNKGSINKTNSSEDKNDYILPDLFHYTSMNELGSDVSYISKPNWEFSDFSNNKAKYLYLVAEAGYGKSRLMQEIAINNKQCFYLDIKKLRTKPLDEFINEKIKKVIKYTTLDNISQQGYYCCNNFKLINDKDTLICLDALDEIAPEYLSNFIDSLIDFIQTYNECSIIVSGRTHNIKNLQKIVPNYWAFVEIKKFNFDKTRELLKKHLPEISDRNINELFNATTTQSNDFFQFHESIIQIPRYLILCINLIQNNKQNNFSNFTRLNLFHNFIKGKLEKEKVALNFIDTSFIIRLLSLLALIMEIKQTNQITKDEFTIILEDAQSDIKHLVFTKLTPDDFFKHTVLKDNEDIIEFENREFQEYLAAKELTSLENLEQFVYDIAFVDESQVLIHSWYNSLSFLLEFNPMLFPFLLSRQIIEKNLNDHYFFLILSNLTNNIISKIDDRRKKEMFYTILYYYKMNSHLPLNNIENTANLYNGNGSELLSLLQKADKQSNIRTICILLRIFPLTYKNNTFTTQNKWRTLIDSICQKHIENKDIINNGLRALAVFKDSELFEKYSDYLNNITNENKTFVDAYLDSLRLLENKELLVSNILYFYKNTDFIFYSAQIIVLDIFTDYDAVKMLFKGFAESPIAFNNFLKSSRSYSEKLIKLLADVLKNKPEIISNLESIILHQISSTDFQYSNNRYSFIPALCKYIAKYNPKFVFNVVKVLYKDKLDWYSIVGYMVHLVTVDNIKQTIALFKSDSNKEYFIRSLFNACSQDNQAVYNLRNEYLKENKKAQLHVYPTLLEQFREKLFVDETHHITDVFRFYNQHHKELKDQLEEKDINKVKKLILYYLDSAKRNAPPTIQMNKTDKNAYNYTTYYFVDPNIINDIIETLSINSFVDITPHRLTILSYFHSLYNTEIILKLLAPLSSDELDVIKKSFLDASDDRNIIHIHLFTNFVKQFNVKEAIPLLKDYLIRPNLFSANEQHTILNTVVLFEKNESYYIQLLKGINKNKYTALWFSINSILIVNYSNVEAIKARVLEIKKRKFKFQPHPKNYSPDSIATDIPPESMELTTFDFAAPLMNLDNSEYVSHFFDLLEYSIMIWNEDTQNYSSYSYYIDNIVLHFFDNLKKEKSYKWYNDLANTITNLTTTHKSSKNYKRQLTQLEKSYIEYIEKSKPLSTYIKKYNDIKSKKYIEIKSYESLFKLLENAINTDLRKWIEIDGAYKMIHKYKADSKTQTKEDLMQKTLTTQFENILLKKGIRKFDIFREAQQLDDKRSDFLIKYGFIPPVLIEIKRSGNPDFSGNIKTIKEYKTKLCGYLQKTHASKGIYLIFNDTGCKKFNTTIEKHKKLYKDTGISVIGIDCINYEPKQTN